MTVPTPTVTNTNRSPNADPHIAAPAGPARSERRRCAAPRSLRSGSANAVGSADAVAGAMRTGSRAKLDRRTYARRAFAYAKALFGTADGCGTVAGSARFDARRTFPLIRRSDDIAASCKQSSLSALRYRRKGRTRTADRLQRWNIQLAAPAIAKPSCRIRKKAAFFEENDDTQGDGNAWTLLGHWMFLRSANQCVIERRSSHAKRNPEQNHARSLAANANDK